MKEKSFKDCMKCFVGKMRMTKDIGFGFKDIINEKIKSGIPKSKLENLDYPDYSIYIARTHVTDHETGNISRGLCKIGRAKYVNNVQRGRNQGGSDFRIYKLIKVRNDADTRKIEKYVSKKYHNRKIQGSQNQSELYDFYDHELNNIINDIREEFSDCIIEVKDYIK